MPKTELSGPEELVLRALRTPARRWWRVQELSDATRMHASTVRAALKFLCRINLATRQHIGPALAPSYSITTLGEGELDRRPTHHLRVA